jgi:hypothetical protein
MRPIHAEDGIVTEPCFKFRFLVGIRESSVQGAVEGLIKAYLSHTSIQKRIRVKNLRRRKIVKVGNNASWW